MWNAIFETFVTDQIASWVHWNLLLGDVLATVAVGWGIIFEHGPTETRKVADRLVIWGIVAETLFSVSLFTFDEGISSAQKSRIEAQQAVIGEQQIKIITLEGQTAIAVADAGRANERAGRLEKEAADARLQLAKLTAPRTIRPEQANALIEKLRPYAGKKFWIITQTTKDSIWSEQDNLAKQLSDIFTAAAWTKDSHPYPDLTKAESAIEEVSDRGCLITSLDDSFGMLVAVILKSNADIECSYSPNVGMLPGFVIVEIGLQ